MAWTTTDPLDAPLSALDQAERELLDALRQELGRPADDDVRSTLLAACRELFGLLPLQFDKRSCEDYLFDTTQDDAEWVRRVTSLRIEQAFLYEDLRDIIERLEVGSACSVTSVRPVLRQWLSRLDRHEREEGRLRQWAVNLDVGRRG